MNGNGVSRPHGPGLNGAGDFYYEAVEGAQSPGDLLLSPAAFINPAQYASVLEGRFKQLQGERPTRGAPGTEGPRAGGAGAKHAEWDTVFARPSVLGDGVRRESLQEAGKHMGADRDGKGLGPPPRRRDSERGGSARVSTRGGTQARSVWR